MRRILTLFCAAAILYLSASYWYLPNSPYSYYALQNISSPVLHSVGTINILFQKIFKNFDNIKYWFLTRMEINEYLKRMNFLEDELKQTKLELSTAQKVISQLKPLTNFEPPKGFKRVSVKVYGCPVGFYDAQLVTANVKNMAIKKDAIAVSEKGLVGRVIESSDKILRIMLLTDITSRVPVKILETGENAILVGNGTPTMSLEYLQSKETIKNLYKRPPVVGDILVTSGVGGIFPPDIMVGGITTIKDETISVKPFVTFQNLEVISILYDQLAP